MKIAAEIISRLQSSGQTLATAESLTGGELAAALTSESGASRAFRGGVIAYSTESKIRELAVPASLIEERSVYSAEVALAMAIGAQMRFATDWAVATTGVAGPGSSHGVAAGRVWVAIVGPEVSKCSELTLTGERSEVRLGAVTSALTTFASILSA